MKSKIQLSILIVHYKTLELTQRCLESIYANSSGVEFEIIIIDNNSQDGAGEIITSSFPEAKWIYNETNEGFGRANNLGAKMAEGEFLLFLNSDIVILENTLQNCLIFASENPNFGVMGPKLFNEDGSVQNSTYPYVAEHAGLLRENLFLDKIMTFHTPTLQAVMGSFMLTPKKVFDQVEGFDPDFFMYCEEIDLCKRIKSLNKGIVYKDTITAIHKHGGSSEGSDWSTRQAFLSRSLLAYKQRGIFHLAMSHLICVFNFVTNFLLMWLLDKNYRKAFWVNYRCYFFNWFKYWTIPFTFTRKLGKGKKILKSA